MKITAIDVHVIEKMLPSGVDNSNGPATLRIDADRACVIACVVHTDEGVQGHGYGWSIGGRRARTIASAVKETAGLFLGEDPVRIEAHWEKFLGYSNFLGHSGVAMMAMSIIDLALWDIHCKAAGLPLWLAVGGHRDTARAYSSHLSASQRIDGVLDPAALLAAARVEIDDGHDMLKVWIREDRDLDVLRQVIGEAGPGVQWAIDVVQLWDVPQAIRNITAIEDLDLVWVEDPVPYDSVADMAEVSAAVRTPICTGENSYYLYEAAALLEQTSMRYLSLDLMRCGGITGWRKIAAAAESKGVRIVSHTYPQVSTHLICGLVNGHLVEDYPMFDGIVGAPVKVNQGRVTVSDEPGIGLTFDATVLAGSAKESAV